MKQKKRKQEEDDALLRNVFRSLKHLKFRDVIIRLYKKCYFSRKGSFGAQSKSMGLEVKFEDAPLPLPTKKRI